MKSYFLASMVPHGLRYIPEENWEILLYTWADEALSFR